MQNRQLGPCVTFFPQPTTIVTSIDADETTNLMTASWAGIVSKTPPTMAISLNQGRKTYENILLDKDFVVNMVPASLAVEADYCGIRSSRNEDKLAGSGLTLEAAELVLGEILQIHAIETAFQDEW